MLWLCSTIQKPSVVLGGGQALADMKAALLLLLLPAENRLHCTAADTAGQAAAGAKRVVMPEVSVVCRKTYRTAR
jgi:hypothetical protein